MDDSNPDPITTFEHIVTTGTSTVNLLAALSVGAGLKIAWDRLTRSHDKTFLIALTSYSESIKQADILKNPPTWMDATNADQLATIADELVAQANENIRYEIARRKWNLSLYPAIGASVACLALCVFVLTLQYLATHPETGMPFAVGATLFVSAMAIPISFLISNIVRVKWCNRKAREMEQK